MPRTRAHAKKCAHPGCDTRASFGVRGTTTPEFCALHAPTHYVNLRTIVRRVSAYSKPKVHFSDFTYGELDQEQRVYDVDVDVLQSRRNQRYKLQIAILTRIIAPKPRETRDSEDAESEIPVIIDPSYDEYMREIGACEYANQ